MKKRSASIVGCAIAMGVAACAGAPKPATAPSTAPAAARGEISLVPLPASLERASGGFTIGDRTVLAVVTQDQAAQRVAQQLADLIRRSTGIAIPRNTDAGATGEGRIVLRLDEQQKTLGAEGYQLTIGPQSLLLVAPTAAGLFYGVQTIRQLLPPASEYQAVYYDKPQPVTLPALTIRDQPRYEWRGAMLDVARHFFTTDEVKRYVDLIALYRFNRLHLHLADDQGWRIEIKSWPNLTGVSGKTAIGDAPAGYYTQAQYADIVAYARSRYITVVPEIDMPGHINAALVAYPDLRCDRTAPEPFTRVGGPPNTLCVTRDSIYNFVSDVIREISSIAPPTPYYHIGGDEVARLTKEQYRGFIERTQSIVDSIGPRMIGWGEIATANIQPRTIVQHWTRDSSFMHAQRGGKLILSPGPRAYLDMKYDSATALGLRWAGLIDLRTAYDWNPSTLLPGVADSSILGLEAPLWAETLVTRQDYEYLAFPRLAAIAELAWSRPSRVNWDDFRKRIGAHGARLAALGVNFARVPGIPWAW